MAQQLALDLPPKVSMGLEDFLVSDANRVAYTAVRAPESWPEGKLILIGPPASGKSHLARVFAAGMGAPVLSARDLAGHPLPEGGALVVEDAETLPQSAEEWLFHAHNRLREARAPLLITAQEPASRWGLSLGDLRSRMEGTTALRIEPPDDGLLTGVLLKHFADRQLSPTAAALRYLTTHMERSLAEAQQLVAALDREALANRRAITRELVKEVLDRGRTGTA